MLATIQSKTFCLLIWCLKAVTIKICESIIWSIVLYGYETWSLTLREEHRLRVFENRMLRRIFGPKRDEMIGGWGKLRNEEIHNLYCSPIINRTINSRTMRWAAHVVRKGRGGMHTGFWWKCQKERDYEEDTEVGGRIILKWILEK
jgi:hypothetical protein